MVREPANPSWILAQQAAGLYTFGFVAVTMGEAEECFGLRRLRNREIVPGDFRPETAEEIEQNWKISGWFHTY